MPLPLITRLIVPKVPPPIVPLKVVEPPVGLKVRRWGTRIAVDDATTAAGR